MQFVINLIRKHVCDNKAVVSDRVVPDQGTGKDFLMV